MANEVTYSALSNLDQARYDSRVRIKAAANVIYPQFFEQENILAPAHVAYFDIFTKLTSTPASTLLTGTYDTSDPTPEALSETQVPITAYERGKLVAYMQAPATTMTVSIPEAALKLIEINMAESLDNAAAYYLFSASTTWSDGDIEGPATNGLILKVLATLGNRNIPRRDAGLYGAIISHYTKFDLFGDTDQLKGFIPVSKYANAALAFNYELGTWLGFRWAVGSAAYSATVDEMTHDFPLFFGANAFGQANGYAVQVVVSLPYSGLKRKTEIGWKGQRGYGIIDTDASIQCDVIPSSMAA